MASNQNGSVKNTMTHTVRKFHEFTSDIYSHPYLSIFFGILLFACGLAVDKAVERYILTDPTAEKVQNLQAQIGKKTASIESKLEAMDKNINDMDASSPAAQEFLKQAKALKEDLSSLQPDIRTFSSEAQRLAQNLQSIKREEIEESGKSNIADFTLRNGDAITLCEQRFSVGYDGEWASSGKAQVNVSLHNENKSSNLEPGQSIILKTEEGSVGVSFLGQRDEWQLARMNFDCSPTLS